jgi:hypothetical protein
MDIKEFNRRFASRMEEVKKFASGVEIKDILGVEAVNHFNEFEEENKNIHLALQHLYKEYHIKAYFYFTGREDSIYQNF